MGDKNLFGNLSNQNAIIIINAMMSTDIVSLQYYPVSDILIVFIALFYLKKWILYFIFPKTFQHQTIDKQKLMK